MVLFFDFFFRANKGKKEDSIDYYKGELEKIEKKIERKQNNVNDKVMNSVAIITFDTIQTQSICSQIVLDQNLNLFIPQACPEYYFLLLIYFIIIYLILFYEFLFFFSPRAIKWDNLSINRFKFFIRSFFYKFLILFYY